MGKLFTLIAITVICAGCATEYVDRVTEVKVPVPVPCIKRMPEPVKYDYLLIERGMTPQEKVDLAYRSLIQYHATEAAMRALMAPCLIIQLTDQGV